MDQSQSDVSLTDVSNQPTSQPLKPTARSVETFTNQMVFNIIGEVTRRNSADLLEGASTTQQAPHDTSMSSAPPHQKYRQILNGLLILFFNLSDIFLTQK